MRNKLFVLGSVLIAGIALFWSRYWSVPLPREPFIIGKNNTVLFIVDDHHGLSNVHVATAHALLERHPHIKVHFASFAPLAPKLQRVSAHKSAGASDLVFHQIDGPSLGDAVELTMGRKITIADFIHPPGIRGIAKMCGDMQMYVSGWPAEEHLKIYHQLNDIMDAVDPAVVVLDSIFRPATDATRGQNRLHAIITPNTLVDNFIGDQPYGKMFWKYPAMGSGIPYPVPWSRIPENIYLNIRFIYSILRMPAMREKEAYLRANGIKNPTNFLKLHDTQVPWITQTLAEAARPVDFVPANVTCTGPITLRLATAEEQDPELVTWLSRAPTVLINLGSAFRYGREFALAMSGAIAQVLEATDVQILWKFRGMVEEESDIDVAYGGEIKALIQPLIDSGRLRVESWLAADPTALLESGHIIASVHHGGAGCYHEAVATGVPAMVLPGWVDLYNFAQLAEDLGIGVWGCPETSPHWNADCLSKGLLRLVDGGKESLAIQAEAKRIGEIAQKNPGRYVAASMIAELAGSGKE
ncbi:uncharacterized protein DNG_06335 [Cephalotrichum gorgonifer]|uniref:Uncharacterized protein n=1 Tax=Cephalotrichum gorgonifer TaxID=2041049 RepID=A0AAE8MZT7_9PEZI|nr:uncharacterized protein DNG_06335 [Cephalotrichum gorgonifer]